MGRPMKKSTPTETVETTVIQEEVKDNTPKKEEKVFTKDDLITCRSITAGQLLFVGKKSKDRYSWEDIGDVQDVPYEDIISEVRSRSALIYKPRVIIDDEDFLAQHTDIVDLYGSLYTPEDIDKILSLPADQMIAYVAKMPQGAQEALKGTAIKRIELGELDSISVIRAIDGYFGTSLLVKMTQ